MRLPWAAAAAVRVNFDGWLTLAGLLLLAMALSATWIRRLPISTAVLYMAVGCVIGPWGFDLVRIDVTTHPQVFERLTEIAIIVSLFIGGLRLRLPLGARPWSAAYRLASLAMLGCIGFVALAAYALLDVPGPLALLIGAALAPTDPVLAGEVTVDHAQDEDRLRYALSGEAGLNDGAAFPFVTLALLLMHDNPSTPTVAAWAARDLLWAVAAGLLVGFALGWALGRTAILVRAKQGDTSAPSDFLALSLIALAYVAAQSIHGWGFLSVFAAGLGLRRAEVTTVSNDPHPEAHPTARTPHPPAETLVETSTVTEEEIKAPAVAAGVLVAEVFSFGDTAERLLEVLLVVTVGIALASYWDIRGLLLGAMLMFLIRPMAVFLSLAGTPTTWMQRSLIGWFGIRGIGTLYYIAFALRSGVAGDSARQLTGICVTAVSLSVLLHGLTSQPVMQWYGKRTRRPR